MISREQKISDPGLHQNNLKTRFGNTTAPNLIGEGIQIHGTYHSPKDAYIEGVIEGGVEVAGRLVLGRTGIIKGNVLANEIILSGAVNGDLRCKGKTTIRNTARIRGNIYTVSLVVEEDAVVEGEIYMSDRGHGFHQYQKNEEKESEMALM